MSSAGLDGWRGASPVGWRGLLWRFTRIAILASVFTVSSLIRRCFLAVMSLFSGRAIWVKDKRFQSIEKVW
jgi:hypothetical protein